MEKFFISKDCIELHDSKSSSVFNTQSDFDFVVHALGTDFLLFYTNLPDIDAKKALYRNTHRILRYVLDIASTCKDVDKSLLLGIIYNHFSSTRRRNFPTFKIVLL